MRAPRAGLILGGTLILGNCPFFFWGGGGGCTTGGIAPGPPENMVPVRRDHRKGATPAIRRAHLDQQDYLQFLDYLGHRKDLADQQDTQTRLHTHASKHEDAGEDNPGRPDAPAVWWEA